MKILNKKILADSGGTRIIKLEVEAPLIAQKARPGQFVVLMAKEEGERIPLTVAETDGNSGAITLIFQEMGFTTRLLGSLNAGDSLYALAGPLGHATEIKNYGKMILVGGGVGIAEIYPVAKAMKEAGNRVTTILGTRTKDLLVLEEELKEVSDEFFVTTDDGSHGRKGFTTDILKELLANTNHESPFDFAQGRRITNHALVYAVGPIPMMQKVADITKQAGVKTVASLNAIMVDGTGMCGCCRVTVAGEVRFSCVDGPEFDAHDVDWKELIARSKIYCDKEEHICRLNPKS